jgi:hypothetical protein
MEDSSWYQTSAPMIPGGSSSEANSQFLNDLAEEQRRQADQNYGLQKQQLDQQYQISLRSAKNASEVAAANKWYNQQQVQLAQQRLAEDQRQFNTKTGYDLLSTLSQLRGPANYFQASDYSRGASQMPGTPTFLNALATNTSLNPTAYGQQGGVPTPESYSSLIAKLGGDVSGGTVNSQGYAQTPGAAASGGATSGQTQQNNALAAITGIAAKGAHQLAPGSLENLTPTEMGIFTSGLDKIGADVPTFLTQYSRSRVGNNYSLGSAA